MKILIAGGTGFIGAALVRDLTSRGDTVIALARNVANARRTLPSDVNVLMWDGRTVGDWGRLMSSVDGVVNLSGASISAGRWTAARKELIRDSRIAPTRALVDAIRIADPRPKVLVNLSAIGYYGATGGGVVTEQSAPGQDFLGKVCQAWEMEAELATSLGVHVVVPRLAVVLANNGGAIDRMLLPYRLFVGGKLGSGYQWYPWVHRDDVVAAVRFLLDRPDLKGPVNVVAPGIIRMGEFADELGRALGRPAWFPMPSFVLRLLLGEMAGIILEGRQIIPNRLLQAGFQFRYPDLPAALKSILH